MTEPSPNPRSRDRRGLSPFLVLGFILAAFILWAVVAEAFWRSDDPPNDDAVMPSPPPAEPVRPPADPGPDPTGDASRGQSAVLGDGTPVNRATVAPGNAERPPAR